MAEKQARQLEDPILLQLIKDVEALKRDVKWLKTLIQYIILPLLLLILGIILKG